MNAFEAVIGLLGGLGLFIYGMQVCSEGLQKLAALRLKQLVRALTANPFLAALAGLAATVGLQSSSAASALTIGFVSANVMTLPQALAVLLGSALGSSLTAQLIAFKITELALGLLFVGAVLYLFARRRRRRSLGQVILGFGLIFYGMFVMTSAMAPIRDYPIVLRTLARIERYPALEYVFAFLVTAIIQSSPAFLAILMGLAAEGAIGPYAIVPFVLGAHLGGTLTGVLSSLGAPGREVKRAAAGNVLFKLACGLVFLPLYRLLTPLILWSSANPNREVANAHTLFSLAMAAAFLPWTRQVAGLVSRLIPKGKARPGEARYLDENLFATPQRAVEQAQRQTLEMARLVREEMLDRVLAVLRFGNAEIVQQIREIEQAVDSLYGQISRYVTRVMDESLPLDLMEQSLQILNVANHLEHTGDTIMNLVQIAGKLRSEELVLSEEGLDEIETLYGQVYENFSLALRALEGSDEAMAARVLKEHPKILRFEKELRFSHFSRMQSGNAKTVATSAVHLDLMDAFLRLDGHAVNIAQAVMGIV